MLCGQGNSGKSTYGQWLADQLSNAKLIKMDDIIAKDNKNTLQDYHYSLFYNEINKSMQDFENVIVDLAHDESFARLKTLNNINYLTNINLITISLRPGFENIVLWGIDRMGEESVQRQLKWYALAYKNFQFPTEEEFKDYPFQKVTNLVIDNSKPFDINDLKF